MHNNRSWLEMNPYEAIEYAAELLVAAGFVLRFTSMKSEARYYSLPGKDDTIRVAVHRSDKHVVGVPGRIMAKITVTPSDGIHGICHENIETRTAQAIGFYIMRTSGVLKYKGKQRIYAEPEASACR